MIITKTNQITVIDTSCSAGEDRKFHDHHHTQPDIGHRHQWRSCSGGEDSKLHDHHHTQPDNVYRHQNRSCSVGEDRKLHEDHQVQGHGYPHQDRSCSEGEDSNLHEGMDEEYVGVIQRPKENAGVHHTQFPLECMDSQNHERQSRTHPTHV